MLASTLAGTCAHACARRCSDGSACHDCMFASQFTTRTLVVHDESSRMEVNVGERFRVSRACLMRVPGMPSDPVNPIPRLAVSPDRQKTGRHLPSVSGGHLVTCKDVQDAVWGKLRLSRCAKSLGTGSGNGVRERFPNSSESNVRSRCSRTWRQSILFAESSPSPGSTGSGDQKPEIVP